VQCDSLGLGFAEGGIEMARKRHTPEEIIGKLRAVEVELAKGLSPDFTDG
jgi:hypothetical protein